MKLQACQHLGIPGDETVHYSYPNVLNVCYADGAALSRFLPVELPHQRQFCLTQDYQLCPTYLRRASGVDRGERKARAPSFLEFFGLREEPFSIVPERRFLCESAGQQRAHAGLRWLVDHRQGLGLLLGPVGTGKTLLCHTLAGELRSNPRHVVALQLTPNDRSEYAFTAALLDAWRVTPRRRRSLHDLEDAAHGFLAKTVLERQRTVVLIVDEAHGLSRRLLQHVCRLLNWQDGGVQLLQVILAGQPRLRANVARLPALRDRTVVEFWLAAMTQADVAQMIEARVRRAGHRGDLFSAGAVEMIYRQTEGMPRQVTILCLLSMWLAYQQGKRFVSREVVRGLAEGADQGALFPMLGQDVGQVAKAWAELAPRPARWWMPGFLWRWWVAMRA